jgi:hypothetical protein
MGYWQQVIAQELMDGRGSVRRLTAPTPELRQQMRDPTASFFLPYNRHGIHPFRDRSSVVPVVPFVLTATGTGTAQHLIAAGGPSASSALTPAGPERRELGSHGR